MSGLVLKLRPGERIMINGVVMENGDRRTRLTVLTADANVLRLRDAIHPEQATTPVSRVCYIAQLVLAGEADADQGQRQVMRGIAQLLQVFRHTDERYLLNQAAAFVTQAKYYQALKSLRALLPREAELMAAMP